MLIYICALKRNDVLMTFLKNYHSKKMMNWFRQRVGDVGDQRVRTQSLDTD